MEYLDKKKERMIQEVLGIDFLSLFVTVRFFVTLKYPFSTSV